MSVKDLTQGNVIRQIWSLAWPTMLSMFFYTLYSIVDTFWVSKLSTEAIAAVSISQVTLFIMVALSMGLAVGSSVVMGMSIGAKDKPEAERVLGQSFVLATIFGVFFTILSLVFREPFLMASGAIGNIFPPALEYFTVSAAGSLLFFYLINIMFAFNSEGDTFTLTKLFAFSTAINVVLDPLLIFGYYGFPELGIQGAAYATLVSQIGFIVLGLYVLSRPGRSVRFSFRKISIQWVSVKKILKIGIPASLTQVLNPLGMAILISIVSTSFLEAGATAFSLVFRLEIFAYLPAMGFGMAAMAMVGQNMGAGNMNRVKEVFRLTSILGFISATILGVLLIVFGRAVIGVFTQDAEVMSYAMWYLYIVAGTYGFLATGMVVSNVFQAMGKSWPGFWLLFVKTFVIAVPLSVVATSVYGMGIWSVWSVVAVSNVVMAVAGVIWLWRGALRK